MLSGIAIWGTLRGLGPFVRETQNESLLLLQAFMGVTTVMTMALAAVVSERKQAEEQLRELAATDPNTGLANYRRLIEALEGETRRSHRTARPFAVLLLDLDGLKKINDRHGHLVGNRALLRLAGVLRVHCRAIDTAARFGGDEFALVLPETEEAEAGPGGAPHRRAAGGGRREARHIGECRGRCALARRPDDGKLTVSRRPRPVSGEESRRR